jgi:hypothetical protein
VSLVPSVGVFDIRKVVSKRSIKISDSMVVLPGSAPVPSPSRDLVGDLRLSVQ